MGSGDLSSGLHACIACASPTEASHQHPVCIPSETGSVPETLGTALTLLVFLVHMSLHSTFHAHVGDQTQAPVFANSDAVSPAPDLYHIKYCIPAS